MKLLPFTKDLEDNGGDDKFRTEVNVFTGFRIEKVITSFERWTVNGERRTENVEQWWTVNERIHEGERRTMIARRENNKRTRESLRFSGKTPDTLGFRKGKMLWMKRRRLTQEILKIFLTFLKTPCERT